MPESPGSSISGRESAGEQSEQKSSSSISGTVLDLNGGIVPEAKVTLKMEGASAETVITSDGEGNFRFSSLPSGKYSVTISSPGLETLKLDEIVLHEGQNHQLPKIALPLLRTSTDVQVVVTQKELAVEQVKLAEKQRVLGIVPNFYSSYIWNAAPLPAKQKFDLAMKSRTDPVAFVITGVVAGIEQARDRFPAYGQGTEGYAKRYGASYATSAVGRFMGYAVLPSVFHQDPRYFYMGSGSTRSRAFYAMTRPFVTRGDNGRSQPNYSYILGSFIAGGVSNLYHPADDRGARLTVDNALLGIAASSIGNLVREFVLRKYTPSVPNYAQGKP
ncbi:carboxypeptidase-like regulatory domain-containing protein [Terriglobus saanensis]|uniref:carboxypeptidase-like regulatory domain-containing protein n=1 Tax=Terriglobus saanensis TaxID=870903 RepID=UPI0016512388|nr:carboxypeptidase-like regulatory domain-containing protein [Terriglobus saanensis]